MSKRLSVLGAVIFLLAGATARAEKPRIAVAGVAGENAPPELRATVAEAVAAGLAASGADVRTEPAVVAYLIRGKVEREGRNYTLELEIVDAKTGEIIDSREDKCEICTESQALEMAGLAASTLKAQVFKRRPTVGMVDMPVMVTPPPPGPAPAHAAPNIVAVSEPAAAPAAPRHRALGVAGIVAGALAAAAGGELIAIDGNGDCSASDGVQCPNLYRTKAGGIAMLSAGVLAVAAGVIVLVGRF
jgi:hypothetical protein